MSGLGRETQRGLWLPLTSMVNSFIALPTGQLEGEDSLKEEEDGERGLKILAVHEGSSCGVLGGNKSSRK